MKTTQLILLSLLFFSCNSNPASKNKKEVSKNENLSGSDFNKFIGKFRPLRLPLTIKTFQQNGYNTLPVLSGSDTNYIKTPYPNKLYAYGLLPDTTDSYKIIWLSPAELYVPVLTTFTKRGQKVSEEYLGVGQCGSDCCYECNETITINTDLSIYSADSIKSCECDSTGPRLNTMKKYTLYKTGKIAAGGRLTFTDILKKEN